MIYVPINHLRPGMIIESSATFGRSQLPLIVTGQILTFNIIQKLAERNISGLYIKSDFFDTVEADNFMSPDFKKEMTKEIKCTYDDFLSKTGFTNNTEKRIVALADSLLNYILSKEDCLLNVIEIKTYDDYTYSHSLNVAVLSILIGIQLNLSTHELTELAIAGCLHDIGKLDISIDIINKPDTLTKEEFFQIKSHPEYGVSKLRYTSQFSSVILRGIRSHHEKYDGTGYPHMQAGEKIPLYGRILAIADVYDAITTSRAYRSPWYPNEAIEYMMGNVDSHFDFAILTAFLNIVVAYPIGTIIELSNGDICVVTKNSPGQSLRPALKTILPIEKLGLEYDLSSPNDYLDITIIGIAPDKIKLPKELFS